MRRITNYRYIWLVSVFLIGILLLCPSCGKTTVPDTPVNDPNKVSESDMVHLVFPLQWILENDKEPEPGSVKITFPASWLDKNPPVAADDSPVQLDVPRLLLLHNNENNDPGFITVTFPAYYFEGLPEYDKTIPVSSPALFFTPLNVRFYTPLGKDPADESITIHVQNGPVEWQLTNKVEWLTVSEYKSSTSETILLQVDASNLNTGTYTTGLVLSSQQLNYQREIPVYLYVTKIEPGKSADTGITLTTDTETADIIQLGQTAAEYVTLETPASIDRPQGYFFNTGDICLKVTGTLENRTDEDISVYLRTTGYDAGGSEVSWLLQVEPFHFDAGITTVTIPKRSQAEFTLYMGFADTIDSITIFSSRREESEIPPP